MSATLQQIYALNPTTVVGDNDLFYLVQSPYTPGTDAGIKGSDLKTALGRGTVTSLTSGTGITLTPSTITTTGSISLTVPVVVSSGGTGNTTFTAFSVICAGSTATSAFQNVSGVGTLNQVLTSQGAGSLPIWATISGVTPAQVQDNAFNYTVDTGITDAYVGTLSPVPGSLTDGLTVFLKVANSNSIANPTFNLNGLGPQNIVNPYGNLAQQDMQANGISILTYQATGNNWQLQNPASSICSSYIMTEGGFNYATDSGAANAYVATSNYFNTYVDSQAGIFVFLQVANTNTGASTFAYGGIAAKNIVSKGSALVGSEMLAGSISILNYDGTNWELLNSYAGGGGGVTSAQVQDTAFNFGTDSGAILNTYIVDLTPVPASIPDGFKVSFSTSNSNTIYNPTLNVNSFGDFQVFITNGGDLVPGDISNLVTANVEFSTVFNGWILLNPFSSCQTFYISNHDISSVNNYFTYFPPSVPSFFDGLTFSFNPLTTNTATSQMTTFTQTKNIVKQYQQPLIAGDIVANVNCLFVYSQGEDTLQLLNPQTPPLGILTGTDTGTANNYVVTSVNGFAGGVPFTTGLLFTLVPSNTNLAAPSTLTVVGTTTGFISYPDGTDVAAGALIAGQAYLLFNNAISTPPSWILLNPSV